MQSHQGKIKAPGASLSDIGLVAYLGASLVGVYLLLPLMFFFSALQYDWLVIVLISLPLDIFALHVIFSFYSVVFLQEAVCLMRFGKVVRRIPISRFRLLCAAGNEREDYLCLSCYCEEEMVQMQEQRWLRSFLHKHDVPFLKRKARWQGDFVSAYLNRLRRGRTFRERGVIFFQMDVGLQQTLRQLYPQLPYRNYTQVTSPYVPPFWGVDENQAVCLAPTAQTCRVQLRPEGIRIFSGKEEKCLLPAEKLCTVVQVDVFPAYSKLFPHHMPLLFVTDLTQDQLAAKAAGGGHSGVCLGQPVNRELRAMTAATYMAWHWTPAQKNCCVLHRTQKNLQTLQEMYPHLQLNGTATAWLEETE